MAEETTVRNVRAPKEIFDRLAAMTKDSGFANQGAALEALLNAWQVQTSKDAIPAQRTAIEDFDSHMQAIQRAYLHALDLAQGAEARALDSFRTKLEALEEEKAELRRKLDTAKDDVAYYKGQAEDAKATATKATTDADNATKHATTLETALEAEKKNAAQIIEDKQRLIDSLTAQLADAHAETEAARATAKEAKNLKNELAKAKHDLTDAQNAATVAAAKAEAEQALAVSEAREKASIQLLQLTDENATLKVELERAKAKITLLESPRDRNPAPMGDQQTPPPPTEDTSNVGMDKKRTNKASSRKKTTPKTEENT